MGISEYKPQAFVPEIYYHVSTCTQGIGMQGHACAHTNITQPTQHAPYIREGYFSCVILQCPGHVIESTVS